MRDDEFTHLESKLFRQASDAWEAYRYEASKTCDREALLRDICEKLESERLTHLMSPELASWWAFEKVAATPLSKSKVKILTPDPATKKFRKLMKKK